MCNVNGQGNMPIPGTRAPRRPEPVDPRITAEERARIVREAAMNDEERKRLQPFVAPAEAMLVLSGVSVGDAGEALGYLLSEDVESLDDVCDPATLAERALSWWDGATHNSLEDQLGDARAEVTKAEQAAAKAADRLDAHTKQAREAGLRFSLLVAHLGTIKGPEWTAPKASPSARVAELIRKVSSLPGKLKPVAEAVATAEGLAAGPMSEAERAEFRAGWAALFLTPGTPPT